MVALAREAAVTEVASALGSVDQEVVDMVGEAEDSAEDRSVEEQVD